MADLASLKRMVAAAEAGILDFVAAVVPWLAPTPTAYIAYSHLLTVLHLPHWVSVAGALVVEGLGLSVIHTALGFWRADGLRSWRLWLAIGAGIFYLGVVISVNVLLANSSPVETLATSLLSFTSVPAALILALRYQDKRAAQARQAEADRATAESAMAMAAAAERETWERQQAERAQLADQQARTLQLQQDHELKLERLRLRATAATGAPALTPDALRATQQATPGASDVPSTATVAKGASKHDATLHQFVADNPSAKPSQIESATGINRGTVSRWLKRNSVAMPVASDAPHANGVVKELA